MARRQRTKKGFLPYKKGYYGFKKNDSLAMKALKVAHNVRQLINVEFKSNRTSGTVTPSTTADVRVLCTPAQGTDDNNRVGNSIKLKSMFMRASLMENGSATYPTATRNIILIDRQPNGALPAASDILEDSASYLSPLNDDNGSRFLVIFDKCYITNIADGQMRCLKKFKKLNFHMKFSATSGAITSVSTNSLVMLTLSNQSTNTPTFQYDIKFRYIDN